MSNIRQMFSLGISDHKSLHHSTKKRLEKKRTTNIYQGIANDNSKGKVHNCIHIDSGETGTT